MALGTREREAFVRTWGTVLVRSWEDEDFKSRLLADPKTVLVEAGLHLQDDARITLEVPPADAGPDLAAQIAEFESGKETGRYRFYVQETDQLETREVSELELEGVAAGACCSSILSCCCC